MKSPKFLLAFILLSALLPVAINLWQLLSLMASRDDAPLTLRKEGNAPSIRSKILPIVELEYLVATTGPAPVLNVPRDMAKAGAMVIVSGRKVRANGANQKLAN